LTQGLTVNIGVDTSAADAATPDREYEALGTSVSFAAGQASVLVAVKSKEISEVEGTKSVTVQITTDSESGHPSYTTSEGSSSATVNVVNTDADTITIPSINLDLGVLEDLWISVTNYYNRPLAGSELTLTTDEPTAIAFATDVITTAADGTADARVTASPTTTTASVKAKDRNNNEIAAQQTIAVKSAWARVGNWNITVAQARSGEDCTLDGLAYLVTGNQDDWTALKAKDSKGRAITDGTAALEPGIVVDVAPLFRIYEARLSRTRSMRRKHSRAHALVWSHQSRRAKARTLMSIRSSRRAPRIRAIVPLRQFHAFRRGSCRRCIPVRQTRWTSSPDLREILALRPLWCSRRNTFRAIGLGSPTQMVCRLRGDTRT